jgi:cysteine-rich repeat protein
LTTCESGFLRDEDCGSLTCNAAASSCEGCGDGDTVSPEECDDANASDNDSCKNDCTLNFCGDGVVFTNTEECDDANQTPDDGCENDCTLTPPAGCGDDIIQAPEVCDGAQLNGEDCVTQGFDSGTLACNGACDGFVTGGCIDAVCADGTLQSPEECDDGNTEANDGCDPSCSLEADEFVLCGGPTNGNGFLNNPFNSLSSAIASGGTIDGDVVMILPQSPSSCGGTGSFAKTLVIQGLADLTAANLPARPTINSAGNSSILLTGGTVTVRDLNITAAQNTGEAVVVQNGARLALIRVDLSNTGSDPTASFAVSCEGGANARLLVDQSVIHSSTGGGVQISNVCRGIISNSLFLDNGTASSFRGGAQINDDGDLDVILSTFVGNQDNGTGSALDVFSSIGAGRADSSIFVNNSNNEIQASYIVSFSTTFGFTFAGGNIDQDPLFTTVNGQDFHLGAGSPARNAANPAELTPIFDPFLVFGVDIYDHDFNGNPRPAGAGRDMGMFEDQP